MKVGKEKSASTLKKGYYRNKDLKEMFGFSNNTIIKYREHGILPFTMLGDVYLYEIEVIHAILLNNKLP
jgi:hypothetical protein